MDLKKIATYLSVSFCLAFLTYRTLQAIDFPLHDFSNSYFSAQFFKKGILDSGVFDPYTFNKQIAATGTQGVFASFNPNPPFVAIFFCPFTLLDAAAAKIIFNLVSILLFIFSTYRLAGFLNVNKAIAFALIPILCWLPIRNQIWFGQTYFLLFLLLVEGFLAFEKKQLALGGLLWGLAIFLKVFPIILFLWLAIHKQQKSFLYLFMSCVILLIFSISLQGADVWQTFFFDILPSHQQGHISSEYTPYQTVFMFLKYRFIHEPLLNPHPWVDSLLLTKTGLLLFSTLCLTLICSVCVTKTPVASFSFLLAGSLLLSPYGSTYSLVLLIPLWLDAVRDFSKTKAVAFSFLLFLTCNMPIGLMMGWGLLFPRLAFLILVFILAFLWFQASVRWLYALFFVPFLLLQIVSGSPEGDGGRVLANEDHNLIFDFDVRNQKIAYNYWDEGGENSFVTDWSVQEATREGLTVRDNQIEWRGQRLTNSKSRKMKPLLINHDTILFLSDYNKGRGFYTLRYIRLSDR